MVKLSGMGRPRIIPPIPVPADGTQTKSPDSATPRDKGRPSASQENAPSAVPQGPQGPAGAGSAPRRYRTQLLPWRGSGATWGRWEREGRQASTESPRSPRPPREQERRWGGPWPKTGGGRGGGVGGGGSALSLKMITSRQWGGELIPGRGTCRGKGPGEGRSRWWVPESPVDKFGT